MTKLKNKTARFLVLASFFTQAFSPITFSAERGNGMDHITKRIRDEVSSPARTRPGRNDRVDPIREERSANFGRNSCYVRGQAGNTGRMMGERNGKRLIDSVWARLGRSCAQLDRLTQIISETPLQQPMGKGEMAGCFYVGYTDALWSGIEEAFNTCGNLCFNTGVEIGNISAQGYCYASIALDGLYDPGFIAQPPLPFCGQNVSIGCKSEYVAVATMDIPACFRYTKGSFLNTFENSVRQDCFLPSDVPIRTPR